MEDFRRSSDDILNFLLRREVSHREKRPHGRMLFLGVVDCHRLVDCNGLVDCNRLVNCKRVIDRQGMVHDGRLVGRVVMVECKSIGRIGLIHGRVRVRFQMMVDARSMVSCERICDRRRLIEAERVVETDRLTSVVQVAR